MVREGPKLLLTLFPPLLPLDFSLHPPLPPAYYPAPLDWLQHVDVQGLQAKAGGGLLGLWGEAGRVQKNMFCPGSNFFGHKSVPRRVN